MKKIMYALVIDGSQNQFFFCFFFLLSKSDCNNLYQKVHLLMTGMQTEKACGNNSSS